MSLGLSEEDSESETAMPVNQEKLDEEDKEEDNNTDKENDHEDDKYNNADDDPESKNPSSVDQEENNLDEQDKGGGKDNDNDNTTDNDENDQSEKNDDDDPESKNPSSVDQEENNLDEQDKDGGKDNDNDNTTGNDENDKGEKKDDDDLEPNPTKSTDKEEIQLDKHDEDKTPSGDDEKTKDDGNVDAAGSVKNEETLHTPAKYKDYPDHAEYLKEKEQRKVRFDVEKKTEARFFCTIWDRLPYMYKRIKKRFVGDLCHAIVLGTPLEIIGNKVKISKEKKKQLKEIYNLKTNSTLLMVKIQHSNYDEWSKALQNENKQVNIMIKFIKKYNISGIQFSNLQPTAREQWDAEMLCKILKFFKLLIKKTKLEKIPDFKIGLTIFAYSQAISTSFQSFADLNKIVYWYSIHTISMVKCTSAYLTGTSPLDGEVSLKTSLKKLIENTNIEKTKIVVSIQLYPNKLHTYEHSTYIEMCQSDKNTWNKWCAARPEHFRLKGQYLRDLDIWGIQLYYMDSDDYKSRCKCFSFPMIRALLRGLIDVVEPEDCPFLGEVENQPTTCTVAMQIDT